MTVEVGSPVGSSVTSIVNTTTLAAPSGADDAATIEAAAWAAVAACQADGSNVCKIILKSREYVASRAVQQDTPATGVRRNAQIRLPWIAATAQKVTLILEGAAPAGIFPMYGQTVKQSEGTIIRSTLTGQSIDATYGAPSIIGGPAKAPDTLTFSNLNVVIRNITVRAPDDPGLIGIDTAFVGHLDIADCRFDTNVIQGNAFYGGADQTAIAVPTHPHGIALRSPTINNNTIQRARNLSFAGWYGGLMFNEHLDGQNLSFYKCLVALAVDGSFGHVARFGYASAEMCPYVVAYVALATGVADLPGKAYLLIDELDIEDKASGVWVPVAHLNDATSQLRGRINHFRGVEGAGPTTGLTLSGATGIALTDLAFPIATRAAVARRTAGNIAFTSTSYAALDSGGGLDLNLTCKPGDRVLLAVSGDVDGGAPDMDFDFIVNGGGTTHYAGSGGTTTDYGMPGAHCTGGVPYTVNSTVIYTMQTSDFSAGATSALFRIYGKVRTAGTRNIQANGALPFNVAGAVLTPP